MKQAPMKTLIATLLLVPVLGFAQTGDNASRIKKKSPATATASQDPDVNFTPYTPLEMEAAPAPPTCVQPPIVKAFSVKEKADKFNAALNDYQACVKNYAEVHGKAANQHAEASNKAVADANAYFNELSNKGDKPAGE
ncbi:hypothetical protein [Nevskia ramosa]|uniref:hypothetical protein n=1 Tax=Nevskia ramosa TaxID=64002 RepID=UPI00235566DD|nr:hypothetical protein [Nevskia ramosa]